MRMLHTVIGNADDRTENEKKPDEVPKIVLLEHAGEVICTLA